MYLGRGLMSCITYLIYELNNYELHFKSIKYWAEQVKYPSWIIKA